MQIMNMTGYVLFWYLLGVKITWGHAQKTSYWYFLGIPTLEIKEQQCEIRLATRYGISDRERVIGERRLISNY